MVLLQHALLPQQIFVRSVYTERELYTPWMRRQKSPVHRRVDSAMVVELTMKHLRQWTPKRCTSGAGMLFTAVVCAGLALAQGAAQSGVQRRITGAIRTDQVAQVRGSLHPLAAVAQDEGALDGAYAIHGMSLVFNRSAQQEKDLENLLEQQRTSGSPYFHHWLQPAEFAARFGVSPGDLQAAAAWLRSQGFTIDQIPPSNDRIDFSGTAAQVNAAFHTEMHRYNLHGQEHWANSTELAFPQALAGMVIGVRHLNTFHAEVPHLKRTPVRLQRVPGSTQQHPQYTVQSQNGPVNYLAPGDVQTIYDVTPLYGASISGTGQYIGIIGRTDITQYQSDIQTFRSLSGLNASNMPTQVVVPGTGSTSGEAASGAASGDLAESDLDLEWAGAIAKDASLIYVTVGNGTNNGVFDSLQYAIQTDLVNSGKNVIPVLSMSYGSCEQQTLQADVESVVQWEQQANAQGQTLVVSAGDTGSADCDGTVNNQTEVQATLGLAVDFPGSSPYSTTAGGTSFTGDLNTPAQYWDEVGNTTTSSGATNTSALSYIPEGAWNDTPTLAAAQNNAQLSAGGGGISEIFNASPNYSVASPTPATPVLPASMSYLAAKPYWQSGPGVPNDGARDVPDISLAADPNHDGYVVCTEETDSSGNITGPSCNGSTPYVDSSGSGYIYGGTSVSAPQLAGMITLWNQAAGYTISASQGGGVGNANPLLYTLAQTNPAAFHDVLPGASQANNSNAVDCQQGTPSCVADPNNPGNYIMAGYNVGAGYDQATGLGSVDAAAMASVWGSVSASGNGFNPSNGTPAADYQIASNPAQVNLMPGGTATTAIGVTSLNGFTGTVTLSCTGQSSHGVSCYFGQAGTTTATVTLGSAGATSSATLTIAATSSATAQMHAQPQRPASAWQRLDGMALAALLLLGLPARGEAKRLARRMHKASMLLLVLAATIFWAAGCSSSTAKGPGGGVAPPGQGPTLNISNYVAVQATATVSGSTDTHSIAVVYNLN
jgi:hypothetical protein